ncbi:MAG: hypothetical protein EG826_07070 [Deltaproteobacteria bacterium]|nr:hypothetical protein [Deltaproteobacteria bacterium]
MTFFRSEEHLRNWAQFQEGTEEGILSLPGLLNLFSGRMFRRRLDPDYFSHMLEYSLDWIVALADIGKTGPFWSLTKP